MLTWWRSYAKFLFLLLYIIQCIWLSKYKRAYFLSINTCLIDLKLTRVYFCPFKINNSIVFLAQGGEVGEVMLYSRHRRRLPDLVKVFWEGPVSFDITYPTCIYSKLAWMMHLCLLMGLKVFYAESGLKEVKVFGAC